MWSLTYKSSSTETGRPCVSERLPYISIAPGRVDQKHVEGLGKAVLLFDFFIDWQRGDPGAEGWVNYRKPITFDWIRDRFPGTKRRTLQRWTARLLEGGYIGAIQTGHGFIVQVLRQKKWPVRQLPLFPAPDPVSITRGKPRGKPVTYEKRDAPEVAHQMRH
jgi:hypothetical protein